MPGPVIRLIPDLCRRAGPDLVDITGGAPELCPDFRRLVSDLCEAGLPVQVRTNLTTFGLPGMEYLPVFLKEHGVRVAASMPCYLEENVRAQRGGGVFEKCIASLKVLNGLGYGRDHGPGLDLVVNPTGPFLPPREEDLERDFRRELAAGHGVVFSRLFTITNMPLGRFGAALKKENLEADYLKLLMDAFNPATLHGLMCRHQVSIGWDGNLYDCDFNLALGLKVDHGAPDHVSCFDPDALSRRRIVTGQHCFGCTAGVGSSCEGALA
jgi:radical SAM/Cys-rich protein